ncbi:MAG: TrkA C-terminal domain-containing protein [Phycisphaeraceae bacterium]|nr:TrkA C-terminal domain-containing protein [Phycisphaeraceae bacterium]MCB9848032.1 TrkA C-terminal domain-containing protein [Phycisphaeraceae bacterium]
MLYALALLIVATLVFVIIRAGATALEMTGLSRDAARFQALSAFFGAGFTTGESELVVNHPVRRRVIRDLIVVGNIGIMSAIGTVVVTATELDFDHDPGNAWGKVIVVLSGLLALWVVAKTPIPNWLIDRSVTMMLHRTGILRAMDYEALLRVRSGFAVEEFHVQPGHWLGSRTLGAVKPRSFGVNVLGIVRAGGEFIGTPHGATTIEPDDTLILYGEHEAVERFLKEPRPEREREGTD